MFSLSCPRINKARILLVTVPSRARPNDISTHTPILHACGLGHQLPMLPCLRFPFGTWGSYSAHGLQCHSPFHPFILFHLLPPCLHTVGTQILPSTAGIERKGNNSGISHIHVTLRVHPILQNGGQNLDSKPSPHFPSLPLLSSKLFYPKPPLPMSSRSGQL